MNLLDLLDKVRLPYWYNLNNPIIKEITNPYTDVKRARKLVEKLKKEQN